MSRTIDNSILKKTAFDAYENIIGQQFEILEDTTFVFYTDPILYI